MVYAVAVFRSAGQEALADPARDYGRLLWPSIGFALVICVAMILLFEVTKVKDRWRTPVLLIAPGGLRSTAESGGGWSGIRASG